MVSSNVALDPTVANGSDTKTCWSQAWRHVACNLTSWRLTADRSSWRTLFKQQTSAFEDRRVRSLQDKRTQRKTGNRPSPDRGFTCDVCSRVCASRIGLTSHRRTHRSWSGDLSCRRLSPSASWNKLLTENFAPYGTPFQESWAQNWTSLL